jgi:hypothetical protein
VEGLGAEVTMRREQLLRRQAAGTLPQTTDWRCYRCGRFRRASEGRETTIESSIGTMTVRVCDPDCQVAP